METLNLLTQLGNKIKLARKELGFKKREDFAKIINIDVSILKEIENGKTAPPYKIISFLCKELGISPRAFIYSSKQEVSYRGNKKLAISDKIKIQTIIQNINDLIELNAIRHNRFDFEGDNNPVVAARDFIKYYKLSDRDFNTWDKIKDILSEKEIYIFGLPLKSKSGAVPQEEPFFIILNSNEPIDRWSFSLLHEIGHLIAPPDFKKDEEYANAFASNVLIPEELVPELWKKLKDYITNYKFGTFYRKVRQMNKYISPEAVFYKLISVYLPDEIWKFQKFKKYSQEERRKEKHTTVTKNKILLPKVYAEKILDLYENNKITEKRADELLLGQFEKISDLRKRK